MGETINNLTFNQDYSCISVSTNHFHKIFNCDPFGEFYSSGTQSLKKSITSSITSNGSSQEGTEDDGISGDAIGANNNNDTVRQSEDCPTAYLKMLFSTSLTIIVPQSSSKLGNRLLKIYNLKQRLKICELTFPSNIVDIKLNRKRLVVFLEIGQIYIYDLSCVRLMKVLEINSCLHNSSIDGEGNTDTDDSDDLVSDLGADDKSYLVLPLSLINDQTDLFNSTESASVVVGSSAPNTPGGTNARASPLITPSDSAIVNSLNSLIGFTQKNKHTAIAKKDIITLDDLKRDSNGWIIVYDTINLQPKLIYKAHDSSIAKVVISNDNTKIATASTKGTIIRVCHLSETTPSSTAPSLKITQMTNLRRGHNLARINALSFNLDNTVLGCGSESTTIHFFSLDSSDNYSNNSNELRASGVSSDDDDDADANESYRSDVSGSSVTSPGDLNREDNQHDKSDDDQGSHQDYSGRSSENLNENLANLLISKGPSHQNSSNADSKKKSKPAAQKKAANPEHDSAQTDSQPGEVHDNGGNGGGGGGYFSLSTLKKTTKLINNQYTKSIIKNLPYREYFDNLIWEPPRRSFAYIKLPEYTPPPLEQRQLHQQQQAKGSSPTHSRRSSSSNGGVDSVHYKNKGKVEIGFTSSNILMLASYQTGNFYHYQLPRKQDLSDETREECYLVNQYSII